MIADGGLENGEGLGVAAGDRERSRVALDALRVRRVQLRVPPRDLDRRVPVTLRLRDGTELATSRRSAEAVRAGLLRGEGSS